MAEWRGWRNRTVEAAVVARAIGLAWFTCGPATIQDLLSLEGRIFARDLTKCIGWTHGGRKVPALKSSFLVSSSRSVSPARQLCQSHVRPDSADPYAFEDTYQILVAPSQQQLHAKYSQRASESRAR